MKRLVSGLLAVALLVTGCSLSLGGMARAGSKAVDPGLFFAGDVPTDGQRVDAAAVDGLAYERAMPRIDRCGEPSRDALVRIGEINSVVTLFAFDECDVDIKVAGVTDDQFVSVEVASLVDGASEVFDADGLPVSGASPGSCDCELPLGLSRLPGAPPPGSAHRFVRISISDEDCGLV